MEQIWEYVNSGAGITIVAGILLYALNRLYSKKPLWQKYEGHFITAIKLAEKNIKDDTKNKALARLDDALKYMIKVFAEKNKKVDKAELKDAIGIVHNNLDSSLTK